MDWKCPSACTRTKASIYLVSLARDEKADAIMLTAKLLVELILEFTKGCVSLPWNGNCCRLISGCMDLDVVL
jgi:hypothetical protein